LTSADKRAIDVKSFRVDELVKMFHHHIEGLPDQRLGRTNTIVSKDAVLGAFAVFFTQSPSFLAYQRTMKQSKGRE